MDKVKPGNALAIIAVGLIIAACTSSYDLADGHIDQQLGGSGAKEVRSPKMHQGPIHAHAL